MPSNRRARIPTCHHQPLFPTTAKTSRSLTNQILATQTRTSRKLLVAHSLRSYVQLSLTHAAFTAIWVPPEDNRRRPGATWSGTTFLPSMLFTFLIPYSRMNLSELDPKYTCNGCSNFLWTARVGTCCPDKPICDNCEYQELTAWTRDITTDTSSQAF